jgi:hypothetical protein
VGACKHVSMYDNLVKVTFNKGYCTVKRESITPPAMYTPAADHVRKSDTR